MLTCVRGAPEVISKKSLFKSLHTDVFRVDDVAYKIKRHRKPSVKAAINHHRHLKEIRKSFTFLTEYYGTILAVEANRPQRPVISSFHEYVEPLSYSSIAEIQDFFTIIIQAQRKGFYLDLKPGNFGKKDGKVRYLDDYGIGRTLVPPDVIEDIERLRRKLLEGAEEL